MRTQLNELSTFECALRKQNAVVGYDADEHSVNTGKSGNERRSVACLEFIEPRTVNYARDDLADIWDDDWDLDEAEVMGEDDGVKMYEDSDEKEAKDDLETASDDGQDDGLDDDSDDFEDDEIYDEVD